MRLHVLFRTYPGSNRKPRPSWYSRSLGLRSLLAALEQVGAGTRLTVLADGGVPDEVRQALHPGSEVVEIRGGSVDGSFRKAISFAAAEAKAASEPTLYLLSEDDYLYRPTSLRDLITAAHKRPTRTYYTLYTPDDRAWHASHRSQPEYQPSGGPEITINGIGWGRIGHTTSTFAVRGEQLVEDAWAHRLISYAGAPFDSATWHALQSVEPYPWRHLAADLDPHLSVRGVAKVVGKPAMRPIVNLISHYFRQDPRRLVAPERNLALHVELDSPTGDYDWAALARSL